jgi:hypothetical protein
MQVHAVKFTDRLSEGGDLESVDALAFGPTEHGKTIAKLYAIENGTLQEKTSVPHGSPEQGYTWHS